MGPPPIKPLAIYTLATIVGLSLISRVNGSGWFGFYSVQCLIGAVALLLALCRLAIDGVLGLSCPACTRRSLVLDGISTFGYRYFHCRRCGIRCKRTMFDAFQQADEPEDVLFYEKKNVRDPWNGKTLPDGDEAFSGMQGALLKNKRDRKPSGEDRLVP